MQHSFDIFETKRKMFLEALERCNGNRTHVAKMLGVSVRTVRLWVHQFEEQKGEELENQSLQKKQDSAGEIFDTRSVVKTLEKLMTNVTEKACTPETVNAACNCADKITQILKVHLDVERIKRKFT
jgi:transposase-like protein